MESRTFCFFRYQADFSRQEDRSENVEGLMQPFLLQWGDWKP
jgi:hypothetical protein